MIYSRNDGRWLARYHSTIERDAGGAKLAYAHNTIVFTCWFLYIILFLYD